MFKKIDKNKNRQKRHVRLRNKVQGTPERPRLNVFRSSKHIYAQLIDDASGKTIVSASTVEKDVKANLESTSNLDAAKRIGQLAAERALEKGVSVVVFDRGGFIYHGRVKALAEAAREAGLKF
ncbi:50S ribosomal protein L18 [Gottschalkiaceae bacterium SANA]|nr:50S ribosomal protein L18 [Gottschalkiaceae bacterium SANA]